MALSPKQSFRAITGRISGKYESFSRIVVTPFREFIVPPTCQACNKSVEKNTNVLCPDCWRLFQESLLPQYCPVCGHNAGPYSLIEGRCHRCRFTHPKVTHIVRVGPYQNPLRQMIINLKFHNTPKLDKFLGNLLAAAIMGSQIARQADFFVPIPLHWRRQLRRKYNQSELLAQTAVSTLCKQGFKTAYNDDLKRVRYTRPQVSLAVTDRLRNLHNAFQVRPAAPYEGKHICLIDDVSTTGTTLRVAANTLLKAGAAQVSAAVIAVAAND